MSDYLVVADDVSMSLEYADVERILNELEGVSAVRTGHDGDGNASIEGLWTYEGQTASVSFVDNERSSLKINDSSDCGLALAVAFGQRYSTLRQRSLRVFNALYDFDQRIEATDLASFKRAIAQLPFGAENG